MTQPALLKHQVHCVDTPSAPFPQHCCGALRSVPTTANREPPLLTANNKGLHNRRRRDEHSPVLRIAAVRSGSTPLRCAVPFTLASARATKRRPRHCKTALYSLPLRPLRLPAPAFCPFNSKRLTLPSLIPYPTLTAHATPGVRTTDLPRRVERKPQRVKTEDHYSDNPTVRPEQHAAPHAVSALSWQRPLQQASSHPCCQSPRSSFHPLPCRPD
jgi:hypothetical protein